MDDGVPTSGKGKISKAHHFFTGQRAVLEGRLGQGREEIIAGIFLGFIESGGEVILERSAFALIAVEDVDAPRSVDFSFRLRDVEQVSERAGLNREGELVHDFDGVSGQGGFEKFRDQVLDLGDDFGLLRPLKKRFYDLAIFGVFGRISFDGELAYATHFFLGRDRDAEGGIGAKGLPIFRGGPDIGLSQDHGDILSLEGALQDALFLAGFAEWVVGHGLAAMRKGRYG